MVISSCSSEDLIAFDVIMGLTGVRGEVSDIEDDNSWSRFLRVGLLERP